MCPPIVLAADAAFLDAKKELTPGLGDLVIVELSLPRCEFIPFDK